MDRRAFIQVSAAVAGDLLSARTSPPATSWYDRPMRWAQLAFVEDDPATMNLRSGLTTFDVFMPMPLASVPEAVSRSIPPRCLFITEADG